MSTGKQQSRRCRFILKQQTHVGRLDNDQWSIQRPFIRCKCIHGARVQLYRVCIERKSLQTTCFTTEAHTYGREKKKQPTEGDRSTKPGLNFFKSLDIHRVNVTIIYTCNMVRSVVKVKLLLFAATRTCAIHDEVHINSNNNKDIIIDLFEMDEQEQNEQQTLCASMYDL